MRHALVFIVAVASGCSVWHWQVDPAPAVLEAKKPPVVRVMLSDSSKVMVWEPTMMADTLRGYAADTGDATVAIPAAGIRRLEVYEPDAFATVMLLCGAAVAFLLYVAAHIPYT